MDSTVNIPRAGRKEWLGLAVLALPTLLVSMDLTAMFLVIPSISSELKPSSAELLWISDIYGFLEASMLITMGTLGDRIGRRKLIMIGGAAFAIASFAAAYSQTVGQLIIARGILGIAGASLLPSTLSLIRNLFHEPRQRTLALGVFTTTFSAGTMLGPLIGGVLLDQFGWGAVFLIAVPIMIIFFIAAPFLLPEFKDPQPGRFDLVSAALSVLMILPVIYGIKRMAEEGFTYPIFMIILVGLIAAAIFIIRQKSIKYPLINLSLFRQRVFSVTLITMLIAVFAWAGMFLFIAQYLQLVLGMNAFQAGMWTIFGAIGSIIMCTLASKLVKYYRRETLIGTALLIMAAGLGIMFTARYGLSLSMLVVAITLLSGGCGLLVTVGHDIILSSASPEQAGAVASITETFTTLGGALGIALLGSISTIIYRNNVVSLLNTDHFSSTLIESAKSTLGGAVATAEQLGSPLNVELVNAARVAFGYSFSAVALVSGVMLVVMAGVNYRPGFRD